MKNELDMMLEYLTKLTKDEADFIVHVLTWTDENKMAFMMARSLFDEKDED